MIEKQYMAEKQSREDLVDEKEFKAEITDTQPLLKFRLKRAIQANQ